MATPGATPAALAAARRGGNRKITVADCVATVTVNGEVGHEDSAVLLRLMEHLVTATGLALRPATNLEAPSVGEYYKASAVGSSARPGCVKVVLAGIESARKIYSALHGQSVKVGADILGVVVTNDAVDGRAVPGGQLRSQ